jgi:hypothetical protein
VEKLLHAHACIERFHPDIVKVDIEGEEKSLLDVNVRKEKEWLIETHMKELYRAIKNYFMQNRFKVSTVEYGKVVNAPQIKVLVMNLTS